MRDRANILRIDVHLNKHGVLASSIGLLLYATEVSCSKATIVSKHTQVFSGSKGMLRKTSRLNQKKSRDALPTLHVDK